MNSYQSAEPAQAYLDFLASPSGRLHQEILSRAVLPLLPADKDAAILDAGCGSGWLTAKIADSHRCVKACDFSEPLLAAAKKTLPQVEFSHADLNNRLPYREGEFDRAVANMVLHDVQNLPNAFAELARVLKNGGKLIATIINPYYAYPVGVWKRGFWGRLLRRKPNLKLAANYNLLARQPREFFWKGKFTSYFYPLADYVNLAGPKLKLAALRELISGQDSPNFNLNYQLHRFPIILLLVYEKHKPVPATANIQPIIFAAAAVK